MLRAIAAAKKNDRIETGKMQMVLIALVLLLFMTTT